MRMRISEPGCAGVTRSTEIRKCALRLHVYIINHGPKKDFIDLLVEIRG